MRKGHAPFVFNACVVASLALGCGGDDSGAPSLGGWRAIPAAATAEWQPGAGQSSNKDLPGYLGIDRSFHGKSGEDPLVGIAKWLCDCQLRR